jgi:hypothetical protein
MTPSFMGATRLSGRGDFWPGGGGTVWIPDAFGWRVRRAEELRLSRVMRKQFIGHRDMGINGRRTGERLWLRSQLRSLRHDVKHALLDRCSIGLRDAVRRVSYIWGWTRAEPGTDKIMASSAAR